MRMRSASCPGTGPSASMALTAAHCRNAALLTTRVPKFLRSLYNMLHAEDPSVLAWSSDGSCFQVFQTRQLEQHILPKYFKHGKFASFQRQLNNFGFRKWTKTQSNVCTFSHVHFVRREPHQLVELILEQQQQRQQQLQQQAAVKAEQAASSESALRKRKPQSDDLTTPIKVQKTQEAPLVVKIDPVAFDAGSLKQEAMDCGNSILNVVPCDQWIPSNIVLPSQYPQETSYSMVKMMEAAAGMETPTSACAQAETPVTFSPEELADLFWSTSGPDVAQDANVGDDPKLLELHEVEDTADLSSAWPCYVDLDLYARDSGVWLQE